MLHDLLLSLLGIEGDFVRQAQFTVDNSLVSAMKQATPSRRFELTILAKKYLHSAEVALIEQALLPVASAALQLRHFVSASRPTVGVVLVAALQNHVQTELHAFARFVVSLEEELLRVACLSVAFLVRKLRTWHDRLQSMTDFVALFTADPFAVVDGLLTESASPAWAVSQYTLIVKRAAISMCVYGQVICDLDLSSRLSRTLPLSVQTSVRLCLNGMAYLKDDETFREKLLREAWRTGQESVSVIIRAIMEGILTSRDLISTELRRRFAHNVNSHFQTLFNLFLLQDGFFWQQTLAGGALLAGPLAEYGNWALSRLHTEFTLSAEIANSTVVKLGGVGRLVRNGGGVELGAEPKEGESNEGSSGWMNILRDFEVWKFPGFKSTVILDYCPGPAGELRLEIGETCALTLSSELLPAPGVIIVQWVWEKTSVRLLVDGKEVKTQALFESPGQWTARVRLVGQGRVWKIKEWKFDCVGVSEELSHTGTDHSTVSFLLDRPTKTADYAEDAFWNGDILLKYNRLFRFLVNLRLLSTPPTLWLEKTKTKHKAGACASQHRVWLKKKTIYEFLMRDIVEPETRSFFKQMHKADFMDINLLHTQWLEKLTMRLFLRNRRILDAIRHVFADSRGDAQSLLKLQQILEEEETKANYVHAAQLRFLLEDWR